MNSLQKSSKIELPSSNLMGSFRLESLEDGVFAIVMTLMLFDLKLPDSNNEDLFISITRLIPNVISFIISFMLLGIYWNGHRSAFHYIKHADHWYHWLTIGLLALITTVPVSTAGIAKHYTEPFAITLYGTNLVLIGIVLYIQWVYALKNNRLVTQDIPAHTIIYAKLRCIFPSFLYSIAIISGYFNVWISIIIFISVPLLYIFPFFNFFWRFLIKITFKYLK
jgi:uncharacterized membrane protein